MSQSPLDHETLTWRLAQAAQWDRLLVAASDWLSLDPDHPHAHLATAQALIQLQRPGDAIPHLSAALRAEPENVFAHRLMAVAAFARKDYAAADAAIQQAIALAPHDALNWFQLGRMCYEQQDLANALKWATRARELAPEDPDILNLCALCSQGSGRESELLHEVLAQDPEHAVAHNNLGTLHLEKREFAQAEACFRRALSFDPSLAPARKNLFLVIKHRDVVYRILCAPRDFLFAVIGALTGSEKKRNVVERVILFGVWVLLFKLVIAALVLWAALVWPTTRFYEFLVVGDLKKKAGEVGATRGGPFNYRRWPLHLRLTLFVVALAGFWTAAGFFLWSPARSEADRELAASILIGTVLGLFTLKLLAGWIRLGRDRYHSRKRAKLFRQLKVDS